MSKKNHYEYRKEGITQVCQNLQMHVCALHVFIIKKQDNANSLFHPPGCCLHMI